MEKILVSACLLGQRVRYNGTDAKAAWPSLTVLERWQASGRVVALCPELAGGFSVPRLPAEIVGGNGEDVLLGAAEVFEQGGQRVTDAFARGAAQALQTVQRLNIRVAVLKEGSPSCGVQQIYSGAFSGEKQAGWGVTTALLRRHGVQVFSETQVEEADAALTQMEGK